MGFAAVGFAAVGFAAVDFAAVDFAAVDSASVDSASVDSAAVDFAAKDFSWYPNALPDRLPCLVGKSSWDKRAKRSFPLWDKVAGGLWIDRKG